MERLEASLQRSSEKQTLMMPALLEILGQVYKFITGL